MNDHVQVLLYTSYLHIIGGIETFVIHWVEMMREYYDIGVYCPKLPDEMAMRIMEKVPLYRGDFPVTCDSLIMIRMGDHIPTNVTYKKSFRMCHACKSNPGWTIRDDCDMIIHVSETSRESFGDDGLVIYNPVIKNKNRALLLVSATRIPAPDKGKNADRMLRLAQMLNDEEIPFLWLNFSDKPLGDAPPGFVNVGCYQDLQPYIKRADYLVQLSDQEGFGYSVAEALVSNTAVLVTNFGTVKELGVKDGENGYIIPFDLDFDVRKLLNIPVFDYTYDNKDIARKWRKLLGNTKPQGTYKPEKIVTIQVMQKYEDIMLQRSMYPGSRLRVMESRAKRLCDELGYCKRIGGGLNGKVQNTKREV